MKLLKQNKLLCKVKDILFNYYKFTAWERIYSLNSIRSFYRFSRYLISGQIATKHLKIVGSQL